MLKSLLTYESCVNVRIFLGMFQTCGQDQHAKAQHWLMEDNLAPCLCQQEWAALKETSCTRSERARARGSSGQVADNLQDGLQVPWKLKWGYTHLFGHAQALESPTEATHRCFSVPKRLDTKLELHTGA